MIGIEGQPWVHAAAVCGDAVCGSTVEFRPTFFRTGQRRVTKIRAECPVNADHPLGVEAQRMLAQAQRDNR